mgnify:CR=1 FL=1
MVLHGLTHLVLPCREMRRFDDEGQPEQEAIEFGEFLIKVCMCRLCGQAITVQARKASKQCSSAFSCCHCPSSTICARPGAAHSLTSAAMPFCLLRACSAAWHACLTTRPCWSCTPAT